MTDPIAEEIGKDEGDKLLPYRDTRGLWTIGKGHLLGNSIPPQFVNGITQAQDDALFAADMQHVKSLLNIYIPWWPVDGEDGPRAGALIDMAFNLGVAGLSHFSEFLCLMRAKKWAEAAADLKKTLVFQQLPDRYGRLAIQIETGVFPA